MASVSSHPLRLPRGDGFGVLVQCQAGQEFGLTPHLNKLQVKARAGAYRLTVCIQDANIVQNPADTPLLLHCASGFCGQSELKAATDECVESWEALVPDSVQLLLLDGLNLAEVCSAACICGSVATLQEVLQLPPDASFCAPSHRDLQVACELGHEQVVQLLLSLDGHQFLDVHDDNERAFLNACLCGHVGVLRVLLSLTGHREVDVHASGEQGLVWACQHGHVDVVRELLKLTGKRAARLRHANHRALRLACDQHHAEIVRELLQVKGPQSVDQRALQRDHDLFAEMSARGQPTVVRALLDSADELTLQACPQYLRVAMCCGHCEVSVMLLKSIPRCTELQMTVSAAIRDVLDEGDLASSLAATVEGCQPEYKVHLAQQVAQQALLHALQYVHPTPRSPDVMCIRRYYMKVALQRYCVVCTGLPAAEHGHLSSFFRRQALCTMTTGGQPETEVGDLGPRSMLEQLRDVAWCGLRLQLQPVPRQGPHSELPKAVSRAGRRVLVLHRAITRASRDD